MARQMVILRLALTYVNSNLDDVCDALAVSRDEYPGPDEAGKLNFNGDLIDPPTEAEIEQLLKELQG